MPTKNRYSVFSLDEANTEVPEKPDVSANLSSSEQRSSERKNAKPTKTTFDMDHYVKPTLSKNPKEVIIHAGTNNIPRDEPEDIASKTAKLGEYIERTSNAKFKHIDEFRIHMHEQELDVLGISETRLDSDYPADLISIDGYTWIAKNRNRSGGAVGFYIRNTINFHERIDLNNNEIETLTIEVLKPKMKPFLITTWYRLPNSTTDKLKEFEKLLQQIDYEDKESHIKNENNEEVQDKDIPNVFNKHFIEVGQRLSRNIPITDKQQEAYINVSNARFHFQELSQQEILNLLSNIATNKATGPDKISAKLVKVAAPIIANHLTIIFNKSLSEGTFPHDWKISKVTPIYKNGPKHDMNNYRPISVISTIAKVMEKVAHNQLYLYLQDENLLSTSQQGFRPSHSTVTALLEITDKLYHNIDMGSYRRLNLIETDPPIYRGTEKIKRVKLIKSLGLMLDETLSWNEQVNAITTKVNRGNLQLAT
ncbi:Hypothetical predicted protein [Paramuricea clavata]|uniref:Uncharacterized protein n=1 Tax=Paramuricea clavata TaxID=317549 RepID=A0A7D9J2R1_PARCT|nr:Hypothetical predicted protein [Paramuricea clavata]